MGDATGPHSYLLSYSLETRTITKSSSTISTNHLQKDETFFTHLAEIMNESTITNDNIVVDSSFTHNTHYNTKDNVKFIGGLVGYIGYEMKSESLHLSPSQQPFKIPTAGDVPDCSFLFADRLVMFDHEKECVVLVTLNGCMPEQMKWVETTRLAMEELTGYTPPKQNCNENIPKIQMKRAHSRDDYLSNIHQSLKKINLGETYEVCLTTQFVASRPDIDPYTLYTHLRHANPAPYAAFLNFEGIYVVSSSPERFMRLEHEKISMKPIKGTSQRATSSNFPGSPAALHAENLRRMHALSTSEKEASENLMVYLNLFRL